MDITTIELRKLTADNGKVLTNGETYSKEIYLGKNDKAENWHEIPESEIPKEPQPEEALL
jgi:hypothetical protein